MRVKSSRASAAEVACVALDSRVSLLAGVAGRLEQVERAPQQEFADFVAAQRERALRIAWRLVGGDAAAAEDVVQEAFARAYRNLAGFREQARLSTWFHRILINEARRYLRWRWVRQRYAADMPEQLADPSARALGDPPLRERVGAAIRKLPRGQREAFVLVHLEGMTLAEAAQVAGCAVGTIKSHLHRATRALREQLSDVDPRLERQPS